MVPTDTSASRRILIAVLVLVAVPSFVILFVVSAVGGWGLVSITNGRFGFVWVGIAMGAVVLLAGGTLYHARLQRRS